MRAQELAGCPVLLGASAGSEVKGARPSPPHLTPQLFPAARAVVHPGSPSAAMGLLELSSACCPCR